MVKNLFLAGFLALGAAFFTGCASVQTASNEDLSGQKISAAPAADVAHINGSNWGVYCLWLPIAAGSTDNPGSTVWFKDTVNVKSVTKMVTGKSKELTGTHTLDLVSSANSMWIMPVFFLKDVQVSGNAVKAGGAAPAATK